MIKTKTTRKYRTYRHFGITQEEFVEKYMVNFNKKQFIRNLAEEIGMPVENVHMKIYYLRKNGVNLPKHRPRTDVDHLNKLIEEAK